MNYILTLLMCSTIAGKITCLPPHQVEVEYIDAYECMLDGYTKSYDKIIELGRDNVNEYNIYIKFGCHENKPNKTAVSNIIIE
tara:strand:- start:1272 stop:1520 length:249 start_codon:yes stop_codon:yes gene_type:complete